MSGDAMPGAAARVALLARKGAACERLQAALQEAGADIVLVSEPADTDVDNIRSAGAQAILVALEPAIEEALERFDALLADPSMTVIFEEADLAAQREGWDAARWTRHLAAKLNRHDQVLPPGAEIDAALAAEAEPPARYQRPENGGDIGAFAVEADAHWLEVPQDFAAAQAAAPVPTAADAAPASSASMFDPVIAEFDMDPPLEAPAFGELTLEPVANASDDAPATDRFRRDLDDLHLRIADMQLEDSRLPVAGNDDGAVLLLAGIGGPDAVRQLLAALPGDFPRPVLIQQKLEGAKHDKLVRQMQRATTMPVALAEAGIALQRGHVYVLPADLGLEKQADGLHFHPGADTLPGNLPAGDSAVVLLSGSDPAAVDFAMNHSQRGALVAGQSPEGCFDAVASEALVARGAQAGAPVQLARMLAARWPSTGSH
jgi:chemosensory pili system protein ChpB (putative protein-glutamate methylesterase)